MRRSLTVSAVVLSVLVGGTVFGTIHHIDILDFVFDPPSPVVAPGDTVRWTLVQGVHTTTSLPESPKQWDSGIMDVVGQTFDVAFGRADRPGPFPYYSTMDEAIMDGVISFADTCWAAGDVDGDGSVLSVADMVMVTRILSGDLPYPDNLYQIDLNGDCVIDDGDAEMWECYFVYGLSCFVNGYPVPTCCFPDTVVGACCLGDSCSVRSEANCQGIGGEYLGDGTTCGGDNPCDCCVGMRGNVDGDPDDLVNVSDLTFFVTALFACQFDCFPCELEADIDGSDSVNVADLTYLVAYLFFAGPEPVPCP